jgi:hypothetical protein
VANEPVNSGIGFDTIIQTEIVAINERRAALGRKELPSDVGFGDNRAVIDAVGLALSGGGIRSAAFSLGVLQALNQNDVIRSIDYLSTVSGGGYTGTSLTATMSATRGDFVFGSKVQIGQQDSPPPASDIKDTDSIGHIRNYSNYLIPFGARDLLTGVAIVTRGLVANVSLVLPVLLILAALTIVSNSTRTSLRRADLFGLPLEAALPIENFGVTLAVIAIGSAFFFFWAIYRSFLPADKLSEFRTELPFWGSAYLVLVAAVLFCELQPFVIAGMFDVADPGRASAAGATGVFLKLVASWIQTIAAVLAPVAAVVTFFRQQLGDLLKAASTTSSISVKLAGLVARAGIWLAGAALPLLIWVLYLYLSYWGIANNVAARPVAQACPQGAVEGTISIQGRGVDVSGDLAGTLRVDDDGACSKDLAIASPPAADTATGVDLRHAHAPRWLITPAGWLNESGGERLEQRIAILYLCAGVLLATFALLLTPNANSLHRLYRDRLSKAFLFDPRVQPGRGAVRRDVASIDQGRDFEPLDKMKVSELSAKHAPYHLINAALNIQGSDYANRRGRNADFFLFSPRFVGSEATRYAATTALEAASPDLDLATAMAISGAAASSNMGANSVRPLTPTLALLNIRLGYWLKNPRYVAVGSTADRKTPLYLWSEMTGRLYENSDVVYLTDGGHIENLGIYELLRRRCRLIVVVDSEADPEMHFPSFIALQRYARIDLGVRFDMPLEPIGAATRAWMAVGSQQKAKPPEGFMPACGPHVGVGRIEYGSGETGYLLYIKSSLSGDENDYVRDYARRSRWFPHETTGDQFFSEEQFEVYRALGFHAMFGFLEGKDANVVVSTKLMPPPPKNAAGDSTGEAKPPAYKQWDVVKAGDAALKPVRDLLGLS